MTVKAHCGFVGTGGVQQHSAGDNFPVVESLRGSLKTPFEQLEQLATYAGRTLSSVDRPHGRNVRILRVADKLADIAIARFKQGGGASVSVPYGFTPSSGYVVSREGYEKTVPADQFGWKDCFDYIVDGFVDGGYCLDNPTGDVFGLWQFNGLVYLDRSYVVPSLKLAKAIGRGNHQLAIFDIVQGVEIAL